MIGKKRWALYGFGWLVAGAAIISLMGLGVMVLWNWLIPDLFNGTTVTFLQAIGLIALTKLLTGVFGWRKYGRWKSEHHYGTRQHWKKRWEEKVSNMSPEQRDQFKKMYYDRCGWKYNFEDGKTADNNKDESAGHA